MSRANSLGGGMQTGIPLLKANVYAAQMKAVVPSAPAPVVEPVVVKKESKKEAKKTAAPVAAKAAPAKRKIVVKVNPTLARLVKKTKSK